MFWNLFLPKNTREFGLEGRDQLPSEAAASTLGLLPWLCPWCWTGLLSCRHFASPTNFILETVVLPTPRRRVFHKNSTWCDWLHANSPFRFPGRSLLSWNSCPAGLCHTSSSLRRPIFRAMSELRFLCKNDWRCTVTWSLHLFLRFERKSFMARQIAEGLAFLHEQNVVTSVAEAEL